MTRLTESSILVSLEIQQWTARKYDKKVTDKINAENHTTDAGRFNKSLIAREHLEKIAKLAGAARQFHYENTLPWSDNGERLLPTANYFDYVAGISKIVAEFEVETTDFCRNYPTMVAEARVNLNGLFDERDYPSNIDQKFSMRTKYMPIPEIEDIRIKLDAAEVDNIRKSVQEEIAKRYSEAQHDVYRRILEHLKRMQERLNISDAVFRNSLFDNLKELVALLPKLNVSNDPKITELCKDLSDLYVNPDEVRENVTLRTNKAKEVDAILNKIDGFFKG